MQGQEMQGNTDMFEGAQKSWKTSVGMRKSLNHLHQFIYQHLKKTFKEKIVDTNKLKYFTYITNKAFHTGVSINEFDFHSGRKHGMSFNSRDKLTDEYVKILGNPFKKDPDSKTNADYYTSEKYKTTDKSNFKTFEKNQFLNDDVETGLMIIHILKCLNNQKVN